MKKLGKFNLKINVIPNRIEKYMSFTITNQFRFIDSFQFLSSSLDSLFKNLGKDDFKYLSQELDNNILDLVKQKGFYPYEYMSDFEKFKEELPGKEKFCCSLTGQKINDKEYEYVLNVWNKIEMKTLKDYYNLYFKVVSATSLLVCFSSLKESTCETWKNVFYFISKAFSVLKKIKF